MPSSRYFPGNFSIWKYLPGLTLPDERHLKSFLEGLPPNPVALDVGSGGRRLSADIISLDMFISENTDVAANIHFLPFQNESCDAIICTGTLEHVQDPWGVVKEFHRVLKPGGMVYVATPFMQGYHPDPMDFWRFTQEGLKRIFSDFECIETGCSGGSGSGLSWALIDFFRSLSDIKPLSELLGIAARILLFWVKHIDRLLRSKQNNRLFASGYFYVGRKSCKKDL